MKSLAELERAARIGFGDAVLCLATIALLERGNAKETVEAITIAQVGRAARLYREGILFRMHILVSRAFASSRYPDDAHLRAAVEFIERPDFSSFLGPRQNLADLKKVAIMFRELEKQAPVAPVFRQRNKELAHIGEYGDHVPRPLYNDLFALARQLAEIWSELAHASGVNGTRAEDEVPVYEKSADEFWSRWK